VIAAAVAVGQISLVCFVELPDVVDSMKLPASSGTK
jgi:hypothetical protein